MMPGTYHVYDYQGNILLDLSEYNINNWYSVSYYNGYFLFVVENEAGSKYIFLIDKEAKPVIDPIKVDNVANVFSGGFYDSGYDCIYYPLDETGFVMLYNNAFCHIDYNGDIIYYDGIYSFSGFYNGLALVKDEFDQMYYINYKGEKVIK